MAQEKEDVSHKDIYDTLLRMDERIDKLENKVEENTNSNKSLQTTFEVGKNTVKFLAWIGGGVLAVWGLVLATYRIFGGQ